MGENDADDCFIWPHIASRKLDQDAETVIQDCRETAANEIPLKTLSKTIVEDRINEQLKAGGESTSDWRKFWLRLMAESLSCEKEEDPLNAMQNVLEEKSKRIIFQNENDNHISGWT